MRNRKNLKSFLIFLSVLFFILSILFFFIGDKPEVKTVGNYSVLNKVYLGTNGYSIYFDPYGIFNIDNHENIYWGTYERNNSQVITKHKDTTTNEVVTCHWEFSGDDSLMLISHSSNYKDGYYKELVAGKIFKENGLEPTKHYYLNVKNDNGGIDLVCALYLHGCKEFDIYVNDLYKADNVDDRMESIYIKNGNTYTYTEIITPYYDCHRYFDLGIDTDNLTRSLSITLNEDGSFSKDGKLFESYDVLKPISKKWFYDIYDETDSRDLIILTEQINKEESLFRTYFFVEDGENLIYDTQAYRGSDEFIYLKDKKNLIFNSRNLSGKINILE